MPCHQDIHIWLQLFPYSTSISHCTKQLRLGPYEDRIEKCMRYAALCNWLVVMAKMMIMILKNRWLRQRLVGFVKLLENCITWTDEWHFNDTYMANKAGNTTWWRDKQNSGKDAKVLYSSNSPLLHQRCPSISTQKVSLHWQQGILIISGNDAGLAHASTCGIECLAVHNIGDQVDPCKSCKPRWWCLPCEWWDIVLKLIKTPPKERFWEFC